MSYIKYTDYLAITNFEVKPFSLQSLKSIPGIYMITNKVTKKFYIGMSIDLKGRIEDYLNIKWLNRNRSSRIHKALLKYGFENFSISILQLDKDKRNITSAFWREREDFFIKVFKPQYNIKRSKSNTDWEITANRKVKIIKDITMIAKNL
jgi:group I intron endonuclease